MYLLCTNAVVVLEEETQIVRNNAAPRFNRYFEFEVPHFRCAVRFTLIEARTGRKIGTSQMSVFSLMQRDSNRKLARIRAKIWKDSNNKVEQNSTHRLPTPTKKLRDNDGPVVKTGVETGLRSRIPHSSRARSNSDRGFSADGDMASSQRGDTLNDNLSADNADEAFLEILPLRDAATNTAVLGRFSAVIRFEENSKGMFQLNHLC